MPSLKERAKTLIELIDGAYFIFADRPLELEPKAAAAADAGNPRADRPAHGRARAGYRLDVGRPRKPRCANFAEPNNLKLGAVAQPLRVALTGRTTSPGIFDVLAVLGREECLARLGDQAAVIRPGIAGRPRPSCSAHSNKLPISEVLPEHPVSRASHHVLAPPAAGFRNDLIGDYTMDAKSSNKIRNADGRQQDLRFPDSERHGRARCHRHRQALRPGRHVHL